MAEREELTMDEYRSVSRRRFLTTGVAAVAGFVGFRNLQSAELDNRIPGPLRDVHELNESIWSALFRDDHLAEEILRLAEDRTFLLGLGIPTAPLEGRLFPETYLLRRDAPPAEILTAEKSFLKLKTFNIIIY